MPLIFELGHNYGIPCIVSKSLKTAGNSIDFKRVSLCLPL